MQRTRLPAGMLASSWRRGYPHRRCAGKARRAPGGSPRTAELRREPGRSCSGADYAEEEYTHASIACHVCVAGGACRGRLRRDGHFQPLWRQRAHDYQQRSGGCAKRSAGRCPALRHAALSFARLPPFQSQRRRRAGSPERQRGRRLPHEQPAYGTKRAGVERALLLA